MSAFRHTCTGLLFPGLSLWLGMVLLVGQAAAETAGLPTVTSFAEADIGTDAMGWITLQDPQGVLLFGCNELVSYDGERWRKAPVPGAYALRGLDFGPDGHLWAAAAGDVGWFEHDASGGWAFHSLRPSLSIKPAALRGVWHVFAENAGAVFVTEDGVLRWDGKAAQFWPMPGARRLPAMRVGGTIYVHHSPTGLYAMGREGPELIIPATVLGERRILWMEARSDGWLFATSEGLFIFRQGALEPFAPAISEFVQREALTSAARLPDGRLALGTFRGGIALMSSDGKLERVLNEAAALPTNSIYSLFVDREGGLWVTSSSHIFRIAVGSSSTLFAQHSGFPAQPALSIVRHEGRLLVASDSGVYELLVDGDRFRLADGLRDRYRNMQSTPAGLLLAGNSAVVRAANGSSTVVHQVMQGAFVFARSRTQPGGILISAGREIVALDPGGHSRVIVRDMPDIATSLAEDNQGKLWMGTTTAGVVCARLDASSAVEAISAGRADGLADFRGPALVAALPAGGVLALSPAGGWIKQGREGARFDAIDGYPRRRAYAASVDSDGNVWIVHPGVDDRPACVARIGVQGPRATWRPHAVEGLWTIGAPQCIFAESAGGGGTVLWIGGASGVLRNVVTSGPIAPTPQAPLLQAFARGADLDTFQPIREVLPYETRAVRFEFAEPDFSQRPALRLQTHVDGVDTGWVPAGPIAQRDLTAMRDGSYLFHVRAVAETGLVSETTTFKFEIAPPWWRTAPAVFGVLAVLGAATFGGVRLRLRALRQRNAMLEEKVRERTEQLAQASAAKTQFVANMSHDIRNPLNGIVGLALALENTRLNDGQREIVATLRECTTYLSSLVDDVLDFASIEAGRVTLRPGPFAPAQLLHSVAATLGTDVNQRGVTLTVEAAPDLPATLRGDAGRIQQILVNYATNAVKYAGGHIRLSAQVPPGAVGEIEFAVADEGPGISDAEQAVLFTKFTRLPNGRDTQIKGTGLGLASCRLLADIMGGSVGVESRSGQGARFFLRLPLTACVAPPEPLGVTLPQANVLVVEDTDYNAWAAAAVLSRLGLAHVRARTGAEALELFSAQRFNIVLLDRNLPDLDGIEVAKRIRAQETAGPRAILLAVTAYCTAEDRVRCLEAGMDAFVGKPLTPEKLRKVLIAAGRQLLTAASVHVPPEARPPAVDLSLLGYLSDGTGPGLEAQVERFLAALGDAEGQLAQAAAARKFLALADAAHLVLSQAKLIGCASLEEAAIALERSARDHQAAAFDELLARVHREIAGLTEALHLRDRATQLA